MKQESVLPEGYLDCFVRSTSHFCVMYTDARKEGAELYTPVYIEYLLTCHKLLSFNVHKVPRSNGNIFAVR